MTTHPLDLDAIQAAAAAALAAPDDTPATTLPAALQCETGCGRPLNIVLTWVADSETRILCDVCALMMFMSLAESMPDTAAVDETAATADDGDRTASQAAEPE